MEGAEVRPILIRGLFLPNRSALFYRYLADPSYINYQQFIRTPFCILEPYYVSLGG